MLAGDVLASVDASGNLTITGNGADNSVIVTQTADNEFTITGDGEIIAQIYKERVAKRGYGWFMAATQMNFKRPLELGDRFVVRTWIERYVIKRAMVSIGDKPVGQTEYRFRGDTTRVAFTESTFRLATDTNSPSVARSMVDVAEALRPLVMQRAPASNIAMKAMEGGMRNLRMDGWHKVKKGITTLEELVARIVTAK